MNKQANGHSFSINEKPAPLEQLLSERITEKSSIPDIEPVITIGESIFAIRGDISFVTGQPKAGKSATSVFFLSTALMLDSELLDKDTLQIRTSYAYDKFVCYVDTEQPIAYTDRLRKSTLKVLGKDKTPRNLCIFNQRSHSRAEKQKWILDAIETLGDKCHLWIIDGVADLVTDVNDQTQTFTLLDNLMRLAQTYNTTIVLYLHENPNSGGLGKMRGNLGSEAERKCGGAIAVVKDRAKKVHYLQARMIRGSADFPEIYFRYNQELGYMQTLSTEQLNEYQSSKEEKNDKKHKELYNLAKKCTVQGTIHLSHKQLVENISNYKGCSIATAGRYLRFMKDWEIVALTEDKKYHLIAEPK